MARKLPLKTVTLDGVTSNGRLAPFDYGDVMIGMLQIGQGQGMSFDEVCRAVECLAPIRKAIAEKAEEVTLTDEQWRTLREKLQRYQFGLADQAVVDFGRGILDAPEIGTS